MNYEKLGIAALAVLTALVFWGGAQLGQRSIHGSPLESDSFLNYVIPKLQTFIPKFSLWDRKFVDRRKLAPKGLPNPNLAANPLASAKPVPTSTPTATPKPTAQAVATAIPATPNHLDNPIAGPNDSNATPEVAGDPAFSNPYTGTSGMNSPMPSDTPTPDSLVSEWKMRISRSPTKQTMNELIFEFQTGKISKAVFYQITEDLIHDPSPDFQKLAIYALSATPSFDSLQSLLNNKDHTSSEAAQMMRIALDVYTKPEHLKVLELALKSQNPSLILGSMPIVIKVGSKMTVWTADYSSQSGNGRDKRGPVTKNPKNGFIEIVEALNHLEDSPDRLISQAARDTLMQISYNPPSASRRE